MLNKFQKGLVENLKRHAYKNLDALVPLDVPADPFSRSSSNLQDANFPGMHQVYEKHHPPKLNDELWRFEKIAKGGAVEKAEDELYEYHKDGESIGSVINSVHRVEGVTFDGGQSYHSEQKSLVNFDATKNRAYQSSLLVSAGKTNTIEAYEGRRETLIQKKERDMGEGLNKECLTKSALSLVDPIEQNSVVPRWGRGRLHSTEHEQPAMFAELGMNPENEGIVSDLLRFVREKEFYKRVGKAWKRGYLLYDPPCTDRSSLMAYMAKCLEFEIYNLDLTGLSSIEELTNVLVSIRNRSLIVIKDFDHWVQMLPNLKNELTLSGLLEIIHGLLSSCGDERIIILTSNQNHIDRVDAALPRPLNIDLYINTSSPQPIAVPDGGEILQLHSSERKPLVDFDATNNTADQSDVLVSNSEEKSTREASRRQCMPESVLSLVDSTTRISSIDFDAPGNNANLVRAYQSGPIVFNSEKKDSEEGVNKECLSKSVLSLDVSSQQKSFTDVDATKNKAHLVEAYQKGLVVSLSTNKNRGEALKKECITKSILGLEDLQQHSGGRRDDAAKNFGAIYDPGIHRIDSLANKSFKVLQPFPTRKQPNDCVPLLSMGRLTLDSANKNRGKALKRECITKSILGLEDLQQHSGGRRDDAAKNFGAIYDPGIHTIDSLAQKSFKVLEPFPTRKQPNDCVPLLSRGRLTLEGCVQDEKSPDLPGLLQMNRVEQRVTKLPRYLGGLTAQFASSSCWPISLPYGRLIVVLGPFEQSTQNVPHAAREDQFSPTMSPSENKMVRKALKTKHRPRSVLFEIHQQHFGRRCEGTAKSFRATHIIRKHGTNRVSPVKHIHKQHGIRQWPFSQKWASRKEYHRGNERPFKLSSLSMDEKLDPRLQFIHMSQFARSSPWPLALLDGGEILGPTALSSSEFAAANNIAHLVRQDQSGSTASHYERISTRETSDKQGLTMSLFSVEDFQQHFGCKHKDAVKRLGGDDNPHIPSSERELQTPEHILSRQMRVAPMHVSTLEKGSMREALQRDFLTNASNSIRHLAQRRTLRHKHCVRQEKSRDLPRNLVRDCSGELAVQCSKSKNEASRRQCIPESVLSLVDTTTRISSTDFDAPNNSAHLVRAYQSVPIGFNSEKKDSGEGLNREFLTKSVLSLDDSSRQKSLPDADATKNKAHLVRAYQKDLVVSLSENKNRGEALKRDCITKSILGLEDLQRHSGGRRDAAAKNCGAIYDPGIHTTDSLVWKSFEVVETLPTWEQSNNCVPLLSVGRLTLEGWALEEKSPNLPRVLQINVVEQRVTKLPVCLEGLTAESASSSGWPIGLPDGRHIEVLDPLEQSTKNVAHAARVDQCSPTVSLPDKKIVRKTLKRKCRTTSVIFEIHQQHFGRRCEGSVKNFRATHVGRNHGTNRVSTVKRIHKQNKIHQWPFCQKWATRKGYSAGDKRSFEVSSLSMNEKLDSRLQFIHMSHCAKADESGATVSISGKGNMKEALKQDSLKYLRQHFGARRKDAAKGLCNSLAWKSFEVLDSLSLGKQSNSIRHLARQRTLTHKHCVRLKKSWDIPQSLLSDCSGELATQSALGLPDRGHIPSLSENKIVRKTLKRKSRTMSVLSLEDHQQHVGRRWEDDAKFLGAKRICRQLAIDRKSTEKCIHRQHGTPGWPFKQSASYLPDGGRILSLTKKKIVRKTLKRKCRNMSVPSLEYHQHVDSKWEDAVRSLGTKHIYRQLMIHCESNEKGIRRQHGIHRWQFQRNWATLKGYFLGDERPVDVISLSMDGKLVSRLQLIHISWLGRFSPRPPALPPGGEIVGPLALSSSQLPSTSNKVQLVAQDQSGSTASHSEKKRTRELEGLKGTTNNFTIEDLQPYVGLKDTDAANRFHMSESTFKHNCRMLGIKKWPKLPTGEDQQSFDATNNRAHHVKADQNGPILSNSEKENTREAIKGECITKGHGDSLGPKSFKVLETLPLRQLSSGIRHLVSRYSCRRRTIKRCVQQKKSRDLPRTLQMNCSEGLTGQPASPLNWSNGLPDGGQVVSLSEKKIVRKTLKRKCRTTKVHRLEYHQQHFDSRCEDAAKRHGAKRACGQHVINQVSMVKRIHRQHGIHWWPFRQNWATMKGYCLEGQRQVEVIRLSPGWKLVSSLQLIHVSWRGGSSPQYPAIPGGGEIVGFIALSSGGFAATNNRANLVGQNPSSSTASHSNKKRPRDAAVGKGINLDISEQDLRQHFGRRSRKDDADILGVSVSTFKRICRQHGIKRWRNRMGGSVWKPPDPDERNTCSTCKASTHGQTEMVDLLHNPNEVPPDFFDGINYWNTESSTAGFLETPTSHDACASNNLDVEFSFSSLLEETEASCSYEGASKQKNHLTVSFAYPNHNDLECAQLHIASTQMVSKNTESSDLASQVEARLEGNGSGSSCRAVFTCSNPASSQPMSIIPETGPTVPQPMSTIPVTGPIIPHIMPPLIAQQDMRLATIKAKYRDSTIRFKLPLTSGLIELNEKVAMRLKLQLDSFDVEYQDEEGEWILISCDEDLRDYLQLFSSLDNPVIKLSVLDKVVNANESSGSLKRKRPY